MSLISVEGVDPVRMLHYPLHAVAAMHHQIPLFTAVGLFASLSVVRPAVPSWSKRKKFKLKLQIPKPPPEAPIHNQVHLSSASAILNLGYLARARFACPAHQEAL